MVIRSEHLHGLPPMRTAKEHVYEVLRMLIARGVLEPGMPLPLANLADDLQVSTMPVRSALGLLEAEGLVRQLPRRGGAIVAPIDLEDFEEIQAIRSGIESFAAQLGVQRMDSGDLAEMKTLRARIGSVAAESDANAVLSQIFAFHNVCYEAARRPRLLRLIRDHQRRAERYLRITIEGTSPGFDAHLEFQDRFLSACQDRDGQRAADTIRQALGWTLERLRPAIEALTAPANR